MRIGLDARCLNTHHLRGMGKAMYAVLARAARPDAEFVLLGEEPSAPMHAPDSPHVTSRRWEARGHRLRVWEQFALPREARRLGCDLLHATGTYAPLWQPLPTVVTVHDTIPWEEGDEGQSEFFLRQIEPRAYRRARLIMTPSQSSADDVARLWPDLAPRLRVLPWGVDDAYLAPVRPPLDEALIAAGVRPPYLLYFGGHIPRKRLRWAIDAWTAGSPPGVQLVACGIPTNVFDLCRGWVPADRQVDFLMPRFIPEEQLVGLYAHALAVLYPTTYEGFGFPALEAQAVGRPVLMSAVASLRELVGPGAVVLPRDDASAWTDAVRACCTAPPAVNDPARAWARGLSWTRVADRMLAIYREALAPGAR